MKNFIFYFAFTLIAFSAYAQVKPDEVKFLESLLRKTLPEGEIVYTNKINESQLQRVEAHIKPGVIQGAGTETKRNSISLSRKEKKYILSQLEIYTKPFWGDNLFAKSKMIPEDSIASYMKKVYQEYSESFINPNNSDNDKAEIMKNYPRPNLFEFSRPIYLRNNSICLVLISYRCGNPCGFDELCFYKKVNDVWTKFVVVYSVDY